MLHWREPEAISVSPELREAIGGHPLVVETLVRRGITDPAPAQGFFNAQHYSPASPYDLPDMDKAVQRLVEAVHGEEKICVWGDFDVDGQTATALLVSTLEDLGARVSYHIPVREQESHGVNLTMLTRMIADGARLILTCDTGISAHEAIDYASMQHVDVIVTDHHLPPPRLPRAQALVNPRLLPIDHPLASLPGVGVAYKLAEALYEFQGKPQAAERHLDLVALGIVADLAAVTGDTRYLLQRGLAVLRQTDRPGLKAMLELAEINPAGLTEEHIGYELGPRLNALGRLADANPAVELLTTADPVQARVLATQLEGLNARRRLLTAQVLGAALAQVEREPALLEQPALVLAHPDWPAGVIGIVASRLVELYDRPAVLIASPPGELARGSARSLPGLDITAAIASQSHLLKNFGGHPMAAGFSLEPDRIPEFRRNLCHSLEAILADRPAERFLQIDGYLPLSALSLALVSDLERLAPFGPGNPRLVLVARDLRLKSHTTLGRGEEHLQLILEDEGEQTHRVIWWGGGSLAPVRYLHEWDWLIAGMPFDLAYTARSSDYRGFPEVQVEWVAARPIGETTLEIASTAPALQIEDHRHAEHPLEVLKRLLKHGELVIWAEGEALTRLKELGIKAISRIELAPCPALIVWSVPPGQQTLRDALKIVSPQHVHLFAVDPGTDDRRAFLKHLAGLVKYALGKCQGRLTLDELAAATAQLPSTVRLGLAWLESQGHIAVINEMDGELTLHQGKNPDQQRAQHLFEKLNLILAETAAYRSFYRRAEADTLLAFLTHISSQKN